MISLGGEMHPTQTVAYPFLEAELEHSRRLLEAGAPLWGVCLGAELLALAAGGEVYQRDEDEIGWVPVEKVADDPLLAGVDSPFPAFNWHSYSFTVPPGGRLIARREGGVQAVRVAEHAWATQFHPEVDGDIVARWMAAEDDGGAALAPRLRAEGDRLLAGYPAFCRRLTRNFVLTSGIARAD